LLGGAEGGWQKGSMDATAIKTSEDLRLWLKDKPVEWAQVIAVRAALRIFTKLDLSSEYGVTDFVLRPIRAIFISWSAANYPKHVITSSAQAAARSAMLSVIGKVYEDKDLSLLAAAHSAYAAASTDVESAVMAICEATDLVPMWEIVSDDCEWLNSEGNSRAAARRLSNRALWNKRPLPDGPDYVTFFAEFALGLIRIDPNYSVWIDWYERRIRGKRAAFDIPGDKGRKEDKKILRRLAEATNEDFWGKGHEYVNAMLKGWLDEARARAVKNLEPLSKLDLLLTEPEPLDSINPDPQDARSPQFGRDAAGRIAIKGEAGADQLRSDPQSLSRHTRALQAAQKLGDALRNHNNAGYITGMVDDYVAAMDWGDNGPDPSGLVFAGDQLREAIARHRISGPDDDLQRLPPSADRDASAFVSAHNMYVGSDHFLDDLDRTTRGPDTPLPAANPDEIRQIATTARHDDILAAHSYDYIIDASNAAPAIYDAADRHSRFASGLAQNFARYGIEFIWTYPNEAAWASLASGVGVAVLLGPLAAAGGTVAGIGLAYHLARNMIANETTYQKLLATSPAGEDNFNRLMRFLKSLPVKSLKDD
jgi:hypothetical protein